jgi:hypothetical protein
MIRKGARWKHAAALASAGLCLLIASPAHATVVGFVSVFYDYSVSGCVYDTDNPTAALDVAIYAYGPGNVDANGVSTNGVNATAGGDCAVYFVTNQGGGNTSFNGHGFNAQLQRPIDYLFAGTGGVPNNTGGTNNIVVYAGNAVQQDAGQWTVISEPSGQAMPTTPGEAPPPLPWYVNRLNRATNGVAYSNPNYAVGINTAFGAYLDEFYNKRFDPSASTNLIATDPGSGFQVALFSQEAQTDAGIPVPVYPAFTGPDCLDGKSDTILNEYNPTQAGSACTLLGLPPMGSEVEGCVSSNSNALCGQQALTDASDPGNSPQWIQWLVHVRNWTYLEGLDYPYTPYDDVYAYVTYTFWWDYLQVDYSIQKTSDVLYGPEFQSLPVAFFTDLTSFSTDTSSMTLADAAVGISDPIGPGSGRWITGEALPVQGQVLASPGNYLTLGFYSAAVGGSCPSHSFTGNFWPGYSGSVQQASALQNNMTFEVTPGAPIQSRALIFPYRAGDDVGSLGNLTVKTLVDETLLPSWDCSIGDAGIGDAGVDAGDAGMDAGDAGIRSSDAGLDATDAAGGATDAASHSGGCSCRVGRAGDLDFGGVLGCIGVLTLGARRRRAARCPRNAGVSIRAARTRTTACRV